MKTKTSYDIYWNLHRSCWSVRVRGKVILHAPSLVVTEARFVVQPGGWKRVRETGKKNVHAFVRSTNVLLRTAEKIPAGAERVRYNPRTGTSFVSAEGKVVHQAGVVYLGKDGSCHFMP